MADERLRRLFIHKKSYKEVSEAYGAMERLRELLPRLRRGRQQTLTKVAAAGTRTADGGVSTEAEEGEGAGAGAVIFDVCSGRGIFAVLLSFWFPAAKIVMMDSNGAMDLLHVRARPNLVFHHVDLYGESAVEAIREECGGAGVDHAVVVGVHLCGALSPRLIDLAFGMSEVDGMILCPCCIKGQLGGDCQRAAKERGCSPYTVLCETFRNLCESELAAGEGSAAAAARVVGARAAAAGAASAAGAAAPPPPPSPPLPLQRNNGHPRSLATILPYYATPQASCTRFPERRLLDGARRLRGRLRTIPDDNSAWTRR
jgi:hypothetical protein